MHTQAAQAMSDFDNSTSSAESSHATDEQGFISKHELQELFQKHRQTYRQYPFPTYEYRIHLLQKLKTGVLDFKDQLCNAVHQDFGNRCASETLLLEIMQVVDHINHTLRHLKSWMRPSLRSLPFQLLPGTSMVLPQPKGVIGIISPWNYPILLSLSPLITALSAGNNAILKGSEFTPQTNACLADLCTNVFGGTNVSFIQGDADIAQVFSSLPFDHLFFTGSPHIGKKIMANAAQNLTPVTLELGGKSPVIIDKNYDTRKAAASITFGKSINAGQTCIAPDYILCHGSKVGSLVSGLQAAYQKMYPTPCGNEDYTSIISDKHVQRMEDLLSDAITKNAQVISCNSVEEDIPAVRKMPLTLVTNVTSDMKLMQEEIFGPILPIIAVNSIEEAMAFVEERDPPLALYLMSDDKKVQEKVKHMTHAGGMCINDTLTHVASQNLPFGGLRQSGMGHYHGKEGFLELSHCKSILKRGKFNPTLLLAPPWNQKIHQLIIKYLIR